MAGLLARERIIAGPGFNRWLVPPASVAIHLCIGSVYAWSIYNPALVRTEGVVTSAAGDWSLSSVVWIFTVAIVFLGLSAAFAGKWLEEVGPRKVGVVAACLWGGGYLVGGLGILIHELWLVYLGYGVIGGCGLGLGYVSPVSTLIRWFPDRRGMATGMAIMGFGGGAIIGAPAKEFLLKFFYRAPEYLGARDAVELVTEGG
ncbi:MAG TPA: MFS transporter, partial [Woeseiaceae bacterium]|nr:MFS transporter [Woeseiaceae bacterium]